MNRYWGLFVAAGFGAAPTVAESQAADAGNNDEGTFQVWLGQARTDNVGRVRDGVRGSYESVGVLFGADTERERIVANASGDIEYRDYSRDDIENEPVGAVSAEATFGIVPQRFTWSFRDEYGRLRRDPLLASGPLNRETLNVFTTTPRLEMPIHDKNLFAMARSFATRRYDTSTHLDNDALGYEVGFYRHVTPTTTVGLVADGEDVEYEADTLPFEIDTLRIQYDKRLRTGEVSMAVGQSELHFGESVFTGPRLNFSWSRQIGAYSKLNIFGDREYTDYGALLGITIDQNLGEGTTGTLLTPNPLDQRRFGMSYDLSRPKTNWQVAVWTNRDDFKADLSPDNDGRDAEFRVTRVLANSWQVGLRYVRVRRDFINTGTTLREAFTTADLSRQVGRHFDLQIQAMSYRQDGGDLIRETRYLVRLAYVGGR